MMLEEKSERKRHEVRLVADILSATSETALIKNDILRVCNIRSDQFDDLVGRLIESSYMDIVNGKQYKATRTGRILLTQIKDVLEKIGKKED